MAIKIPSKNIYDIENPKIRDNVIDNVSVDWTVVTPNNEYSVTVLSKEERISSSSLGQNQEYTNAKAYEEYHNNQAGTVDYIRAKIAYSRCFDKKISIFTVKVPLIQKNKYVSELIIGKNKENGTNNIGVELYGYQNHYTANSTWNCKRVGTQIGGYTTPTITKNPINYTLIEDNSKNPPTTISLPTEIVVNVADSGLPNMDVSSKIEINDEGNLSTAKYTIKEENDIEYYELTLQIMHSFNVETMAGANGSYGQSTNVYLSGERIDYVAQSLQITIQGNTIGIDLTDGSIIYEVETTNKPLSLSGNELMQASNYRDERQDLVEKIDFTIGTSVLGKYYTSVHLDSPYPLDTYVDYTTANNINGTAIINAFDTTHRPAIESVGGYATINSVYRNQVSTTYEYLKQVQKQYAKGKETATLRCSISDYYDDKTGEQVIYKIGANDLGESKNMLFKLHDKVIPYIYLGEVEGRRKYKPMSKYSDGYPKVFEVVGLNIIYDGAVWQELTLQEVLSDNVVQSGYGKFILVEDSMLMTSKGKVFHVKVKGN